MSQAVCRGTRGGLLMLPLDHRCCGPLLRLLCCPAAFNLACFPPVSRLRIASCKLTPLALSDHNACLVSLQAPTRKPKKAAAFPVR